MLQSSNHMYSQLKNLLGSLFLHTISLMHVLRVKTILDLLPIIVCLTWHHVIVTLAVFKELG